MGKEYIENVRAIAGVGRYKISQQKLLILRHKYNLTDEAMAEMKAYCNMNRIMIYNEEEEDDSDVRIKVSEQQVSKIITEEEKIRLEKVDLITEHIIILATVRAEKREQRRGWLCGTYARRIQEKVNRFLLKQYSESEMDYIISHLPEEKGKDTCFHMVDAENPQKMMRYNEELNRIIPKLRLNHYYSDKK